ncbi:Rid family detoxifying hydrolase [Buchnera aphidicola]|uniref:Rid family detoxifying hydrolase n=1 Tax=Buchnera aphidicola TaxID=9 RepID=UPI003464A127
MSYIIDTKNAPHAIGPYSQAIKIDNFLIISGQIPIDIKSQKIPKNIKEQTNIVLKNIQSIIHAAGLEVKDIIKTTIFLTDLKNMHIVNDIYKKFFIENKANFPARSCVEISALPKDADIEIEAMAYLIKN